ncbi:MAG: RNA methyltransferase [Acidobacteria bacterium]|nr:RNA methyltransferase [Acidobacteriota bacterium]
MVITSPHNETVKDIRRLRQSKGDRALLEGPHLLSDALDAKLPLETVLVTPEARQRPDVAAILARLPRPPLEVDARILDRLADADSPRGLVAVARLPRPGLDALPVVSQGVYVFAEGLQDPGNLGALARSTEAFGGSALVLAPGSVHPNHPRALRASAGSLLRLPVATRSSLDALRTRLGALEPRCLALVPHGGDDLLGADLSGTLVLLLGAEGPGLSADALDGATGRLTIPFASPVESLNATVAAAVALFEIRRRRATAAVNPPA